MNPIDFSRNLFALRMEHKISVEELAELLNVAPEIICEWECAKTSPTMEQMDRLAKIYRIPLDEIVRTIRPRPNVTVPPQEMPEEEPVTAEEATPEEPEQNDTRPPEEAIPLPRRGKKPRSRWWDVLVILLLLGIMAAATVFLINPEWFPWLK